MSSVSSRVPGETWAVVLAAGDGTRLQSLTTDHTGNSVPKQFCYLNGSSLLCQALLRAEAAVHRERIVPVVSAKHAQFWRSSLATLPTGNIVVQPANLGTAIGILLPALWIARRDPDARVVILPSDHYVADEGILAAALRRALTVIAHHPRGIALLGVEAEEPDTGLGYIVPSPGARADASTILRFFEKPTAEEARRLCEYGALWNTFILACRIESLVSLYLSRYPAAVARLQNTDLDDYFALSDAYDRLPSVDISRQIATGQEEQLIVIRVPRCGWNDLGTPSRLARTLRVQAPPDPAPAGTRSARRDYIDLAERLLGAFRNDAKD